jgi:hypothetical protein
LKAGCKGCTGFDSPFVCNCDHPWSSHEQVTITITPSLEAMSAFSEVCGGAAGVQRGGVDLTEQPMALMSAGLVSDPQVIPKSAISTKTQHVSVPSKPSVAAGPRAALLPQPAPLQDPAQHSQPLAPSRALNGSLNTSAAQCSTLEAKSSAPQASKIPSLSRFSSVR